FRKDCRLARTFLDFFTHLPSPSPLPPADSQLCTSGLSVCCGRERAACSNRLLLFRSFSSVPDSSTPVTWMNKVFPRTYRCWAIFVAPLRGAFALLECGATLALRVFCVKNRGRFYFWKTR